MMAWESAEPGSTCAVYHFCILFFLLTIVVEIPRSILEDGQNSKNQSCLVKNKSTTFCQLVHSFCRITAKTRPTLPWKGWPNKQYHFSILFFLLIILLQIPRNILQDGQKSKNQCYLVKNKSTTFCQLVHSFYRITAKTRPTLPWKDWPNKQYC